MCKGADSILLPRCEFKSKEEKEILRKTEENLKNFAIEGLRTLVMGKKPLSEKEY